ncbi:MAG: heavy metal translocating P-type ATPase [Spirochaetota bacterium]
MSLCDHCALPVKEGGEITADFDGEVKIFCCHACLGVYGLIHGEGLDGFYERRRGWSPGPVETRAIDAAAFRNGVREVGAECETDIMVDGIRCASCIWLNEKILERTEGVTFAQLNYATHRARIRWDPSQLGLDAILARIASIGYVPRPYVPQAFEEEQGRQARDLLQRFGTAAFFSMQLMLFSVALYAGFFQGMDEAIKRIFHLISLVMATPVLFYSGWPLIKGSIRGLMNRAFTMDLLIAAGASSAYFYSIMEMFGGGEVYFDTVAMIITLILLGRYLERMAKNKASESINQLVQLAPREARRVEAAEGSVAPGTGAPDTGADGEPVVQAAASQAAVTLAAATRTMIPVELIAIGDSIEVLPGERIPLDGIVLLGASEVDESMLSGESRPCAKGPGSMVYGGTMNLHGHLVFEVAVTGKDTVLAGIIRAVEDAQSRRAPIQAVADRAVALFVPTVLIIAIATFFGWILAGATASKALMDAVSVLVIACPCALGLATPLAILIGTSHAASLGILIKGGDVVEKGSRIDFVVFDKTGTLTEGRPTLTYFRAAGLPEAEVLSLAASLERLSEHSLAKAVLETGRGLETRSVSDFAAVPGRGAEGRIEGMMLRIGTREFVLGGAAVSEDAVLSDPAAASEIEALESSGVTVFYLSVEGQIRGVFGVSDSPRPEAAEAVRSLGHMGMGVAMITGDNRGTALSIAGKVGIAEVHAQTSPSGKAGEIGRLEAAGRRVLMVGDGINDAPALVEASIGMALGRATDVALESADIVTVRPNLALVARSIGIMKKTFSIIRQNIFWAFFYNVVAIPLALAGILHPIVAAAAMALSSLTVVGNSLRARRS